MAKKKKPEGVGEIARRYLKHQVYGTLYAVDMDNTGEVLAHIVVTEATACPHTLAGYTLGVNNETVDINTHIRDFEVFEPRCVDAGHLLADLGTQEQVCQVARHEWTVARSHAKELKENLEKAEALLRSMVREATTPAAPLPLFDAPPDAAGHVDDAGAPGVDGVDGVDQGDQPGA
jgi:hypothetical protein